MLEVTKCHVFHIFHSHTEGSCCFGSNSDWKCCLTSHSYSDAVRRLLKQPCRAFERPQHGELIQIALHCHNTYIYTKLGSGMLAQYVKGHYCRELCYVRRPFLAISILVLQSVDCIFMYWNYLHLQYVNRESMSFPSSLKTKSCVLYLQMAPH